MDGESEVRELLVSVLIVSHNSAPALRACIEALERSSERQSIEILVVDNGSRDGSASIDSDFPGVTVLRLPHNLGLTRARNIGIRTAKAEHLLLLSPDVLVEPATVMSLARRLAAESSALAVCPLLIDEQGRGVSTGRKLPTPEQLKTAWREPGSIPATSIDAGAGSQAVERHDGKALLLRRQTLLGIHYLDEQYGEAWIDLELAWQIRRAGKKILVLPDVPARLNKDAALWKPSEPGVRAAYDADAASGAARYISKQAGTMSGILFRLSLVLTTLLQLLTFSDFGYRSALLSRLASSSKIDGTDHSL
jgi:GT2 family glycosyltransferase